MRRRELFSQREKRERGDPPAPIQHDELPDALRSQVSQLVGFHLGPNFGANAHVKEIVEGLRLETGRVPLVFDQYDRPLHTPLLELLTYLGQASLTDFLDAVSYVGDIIVEHYPPDKPHFSGRGISYHRQARDLVKDLNERFRQHVFGFEFVNYRLRRIGSPEFQDKVVSPALTLLRDPRLKHANEEYNEALVAMGRNDFKSAVLNACMAFESTMKVLLHEHGVSGYQEKTVKDLVKAILDHKIVTLRGGEQNLNGFKDLLGSLATPRNKQASHGRGVDGQPTDEVVAEYAVHQTAAVVLMLGRLLP